MNGLAPGKWQRLRSLTDEEGRFKMMAIDQRDSLRRALGQATGRGSEQVNGEELAEVKALITKELAPLASAVLTDPEYGYPYSLPHLPPRVGLLLACEESGYERAGPDGRERASRLLAGWSAREALRLGADAVKLLIYYRPDGSEEVRVHQQALVQQVGEECASVGLPFLLEIVGYPVHEASADSAEFARRKPELVIGSAAEFSAPRYNVDILKLEFPADLKWTREYARGAFDGKEREPAYALADVRRFCQELDEAAGVPWVILSAGVGIGEFLAQLELAVEAGASGFLCGRAIWQGAVGAYPDMARMERWLREEGRYNFVRANAVAHRARPWYAHRRFRGSKG